MNGDLGHLSVLEKQPYFIDIFYSLQNPYHQVLTVYTLFLTSCNFLPFGELIKENFIYIHVRNNLLTLFHIQTHNHTTTFAFVILIITLYLLFRLNQSHVCTFFQCCLLVFNKLADEPNFVFRVLIALNIYLTVFPYTRLRYGRERDRRRKKFKKQKYYNLKIKTMHCSYKYRLVSTFVINNFILKKLTCTIKSNIIQTLCGRKHIQLNISSCDCRHYSDVKERIW